MTFDYNAMIPPEVETRELVEEMNRAKKRLSNAELIKLFWKCSKKHSELTKHALFGKKYFKIMNLVT